MTIDEMISKFQALGMNFVCAEYVDAERDYFSIRVEDTDFVKYHFEAGEGSPASVMTACFNVVTKPFEHHPETIRNSIIDYHRDDLERKASTYM
jgi:hypothetical protein